MLKKIQSGISFLVSLLLFLMLASNLYALYARKVLQDPAPTIFGVSSAIVVSGSMSGAIEVNDMIFTKACDDYAVGDIIMFRSGKSAVTHRIVERTEDGFVTKGDANNTPDMETVAPGNVVGKVIFVVPGFGLLTGFLQTKRGALGVGLLLLLLAMLPGTLESKGKGGEGNAEENER